MRVFEDVTASDLAEEREKDAEREARDQALRTALQSATLLVR